jgi:phage integrase
MNQQAAYFILRALGYSGKQTVHGSRKVFSTRANESGLWENKLIEKQLSHIPREIEAVYDHSSMIEPRRRMMEWWADQVMQWRGLV